jgi:hypothetical protein
VADGARARALSRDPAALFPALITAPTRSPPPRRSTSAPARRPVDPSAHALAKRRTLNIEELANERFVVPPAGRPQRTRLEAAFRKRGIRLDVGATATGWDVTVRLVELGLGVAVVNASVQVPRGLAKIPLRELPRVRYVAMTRRGPRADVKELVTALREHAGSVRSARA